MIDDTRGGRCNVTSSRLASSIEEIGKHTIDRFHVRGWARSLRFLTFEGEQLDNGGDQTKQKEVCARCEFKVPISATAHICQSHGRFRHSSSDKPPQKMHSCEHVARVTCASCQTVPLFPNNTKVTRFRIRRISAKNEGVAPGFTNITDLSKSIEPACNHFVALSYCWAAQLDPGNQTTNHTEAYKVVEEDGSVRDVRASQVIIDRTVAFASQNGYRLIWIDQECIEQDNEFEKAIAVQAMDLVYLNAHVTLGLFSTVLEQRHLENLLFFEDQVLSSLGIVPRASSHATTRRRPTIRVSALTEAIQRVVGDPWNSRAWILQEAFASVGNLLILIPTEKHANLKHMRLICHERSFSEACIDFRVLFKSLQITQQFLERPIKGVGFESVLERLKWLHPETSVKRMFELSIGHTQLRSTCDAAVALPFLRHRENSIAVDRLAIISNMCGYELRLDTSSLGNAEPSLGMCVVALAIMNGDFSLLTPEFYNIRGMPMSTTSALPFLDSLVSSINLLQTVTSNMLVPQSTNLGPAAPESYVLTGKSLRLPGLLWKVQRPIKLDSIQAKYGSQWLRLHEQRRNLLERYTSEREIAASTLVADHMRRRERAVTQILFEVLICLRTRGEIKAADAIWQSVWNPSWSKTEKLSFVLQSVEDFPEHVKIESRRNMFHLDKIDAVTYHPEWLIDRIITQGSIWLSILIRNSEDDEYLEEKEESTVSAPDMVTRTIDDLFDDAYYKIEGTTDQYFLPDLLKNSREKMRLARKCLPLDDNGIVRVLNAALRDEDGSDSDSIPVDILFSLLQNKFWVATTGVMLQKMNELFITTYAGYPKRTDASKFRQSAAFTLQQMMFSLLLEFKELSRMSLLRGQCAVFDIDGMVDHRALVLTPFQLSMEGILAPTLRFLSFSRVVEKAGDGAGQTKYETFRTKRMIRGMWQTSMYPGGRYVII